MTKEILDTDVGGYVVKKQEDVPYKARVYCNRRFPYQGNDGCEALQFGQCKAKVTIQPEYILPEGVVYCGIDES